MLSYSIEMHPTDMWKAIEPRMYRDDSIRTECSPNRSRAAMSITKRIYRRMVALIEKAGGDYKKVEAFLKSPIKIRALGGNLQGTDNTNCNVWHVKQKRDKSVRIWDEYLASSHADGSQQLPSRMLRPHLSDLVHCDHLSITPRCFGKLIEPRQLLRARLVENVVEPAGPSSAVRSYPPLPAQCILSTKSTLS